MLAGSYCGPLVRQIGLPQWMVGHNAGASREGVLLKYELGRNANVNSKEGQFHNSQDFFTVFKVCESIL